MLNAIWLGMIALSVLWAAFTGRMGEVQDALLGGAKTAVNVVIGLVGIMIFFLGLMRVARDAGLLRVLARALGPAMRRLFPDVPQDSPAMQAMILNIASNMLGMGNAATPFGLKAMVELEKLNPVKGVATNSMALFLAINTSAVTLLPTGAIATRAALGSENAASIFFPTILATICSTAIAIVAAKTFQRFSAVRALASPDPDAPPSDAPEVSVEEELGPDALREPAPVTRRLFIWGVVLALAVALGLHVRDLTATQGGFDIFLDVAKTWLLPLLVLSLLLVGVRGRVPVYESLVAGGREGLDVAIRIVPFLVAILVAVAMFRASGAFDALIQAVAPVTALIGTPAEALPMALLRPLSGSGAFGVMTEIMTTHGPDSFVGVLVSTLQGSTETTFYVLAVYFGAARIRNARHTLPACLSGDLAGFLGAVVACHLFFS